MIKLFLSLSVISSSFVGAFADDSVLNSDPININGYVSEAPSTDGELEKVRGELRKQKQTIQINKEKSKKYKELGRTTEKLADVTEELIDERKEATTTIDKYNKKIECLMQENPGADCDEYVRRKQDTISVSQAAPAPVVVAEAPAKRKMGDVIKVLPYAGVMSIQSENEDLEAGLHTGLKVESDLTNRFSVGLGINYTNLKTTDFGDNGGFGTIGFGGSGFGREVEYTNLSFDMYSKFFLVKTERFRPYVGLGIIYNRTTAEYTSGNNTQINVNGFNGQAGDQEVNANIMSAKIIGGSEILFTENVGMNLELQYSKGLGSSFGGDSDSSDNVFGTTFQNRLEDLSEEINTAHTISVSVGVLVLF
jgi:opacity protein-like surface antigen